MKNRLYFLDNFRTFLVFLVVLFHAQFVYVQSLETIWIVSDPVKNNAIGLIGMYIDLFVMYGLFFVSGYFIPASLKQKSGWAFVVSKFKRIILPWLIAVLTLIPTYKAIYLFSRGLPQEKWFTYFHWFQRVDGNPYLFSDNLSQNWLWFLPVLFIFQIIYYGFSRLKILPEKMSVKTGVLAVFVGGLFYSLLISALNFTGWHDSILLHFQRERFAVYFLVFMLGALCFEKDVFSSEKRNKKFVIINVVLTIALGVYTVAALNLFFNIAVPDRNFFFISEFADLFLYYVSQLLSMLSFIYILTNLFRFKFNKTNALLKHLSNNSYSVYIIHMIVLGIIGLGMLNIHLPAFVKYVLLATLTFIVSNVLAYFYKKYFQKISIIQPYKQDNV